MKWTKSKKDYNKAGCFEPGSYHFEGENNLFESGISLVETLVALVILSISFLGSGIVVLKTQKMLHQAKERISLESLVFSIEESIQLHPTHPQNRSAQNP